MEKYVKQTIFQKATTFQTKIKNLNMSSSYLFNNNLGTESFTGRNVPGVDLTQALLGNRERTHPNIFVRSQNNFKTKT